MRRRGGLVLPERDGRGLFDPKLRERLATVSEDAYVKEGLERTLAAYRLAALDGLSEVGTQTSTVWLERIAPALTDPALRRASQLALAKLRDRRPR
jgi:hypothetical protein